MQRKNRIQTNKFSTLQEKQANGNTNKTTLNVFSEKKLLHLTCKQQWRMMCDLTAANVWFIFIFIFRQHKATIFFILLFSSLKCLFLSEEKYFSNKFVRMNC